MVQAPSAGISFAYSAALSAGVGLDAMTDPLYLETVATRHDEFRGSDAFGHSSVPGTRTGEVFILLVIFIDLFVLLFVQFLKYLRQLVNFFLLSLSH